MTKALYRKYRPCKLADVVGEDQVTTPLGEALKSGKFSHAYLFTGPRGCGKTSVARIFAHEVNQFKYEIEDDYVDIIEIDAASNTGVDNIRDLREKACVVPSVGKYKIYIIDEVHMLSKSAFNALLKTLEEPPEHVIFIMATTDPEKVPITITSRSQVFQFRLASPEIMEKHLANIAKKEKIPIEKGAISLIARRGGGSFRDSLSLLDQISTLSSEKITAEAVESALGLPRAHTITDLLAAYRGGDLAAASASLESYYATGGKANILAEELIAAILAAPDATFYHLLSDLTTVKDPFAEAKLLLCFMPRTPAPAGNTENSAGGADERVSIRERVAPVGGGGSGADGGAPENSRREFSGGSPEATGPASPSSPFDWPSYLDRVDQDSARLRVLLNQSSYTFDGQTLTIIPGNYQATKAFARSADAEILRKHLDGYTLRISDNIEKPKLATKDPTISQISDIMGGIQEVNTRNGGDPF